MGGLILSILKLEFMSRIWRLPCYVGGGVLAGLVLLIIHISNATSYMTDEPTACINCHIMQPQYASWSRSSHAQQATCNDCHVPHNNIVNKYFFKAKDGLRHSAIFTLGIEPQVIRMIPASERVVQQNCLRCHEQLHTLVTVDESRYCWDCHRETPHGGISSLSSAPNAVMPRLPDMIPLKKQEGDKP